MGTRYERLNTQEHVTSSRGGYYPDNNYFASILLVSNFVGMAMKFVELLNLALRTFLFSASRINMIIIPNLFRELLYAQFHSKMYFILISR